MSAWRARGKGRPCAPLLVCSVGNFPFSKDNGVKKKLVAFGENMNTGQACLHSVSQ